MAVLADPTRTPVAVPVGDVSLPGELTSPTIPAGVIVVADESVPGAMVSGHRDAAAALVHAGFATLELDLRASGENFAAHRALRRDVQALADRLQGALAWLADHRQLSALPIGLFGAGAGAAAALVVASRSPAVRAIVSRCGRPDLAYDVLGEVRCPTAWIVGGADTELLDIHHQALRRISANARLHVVPGVGRCLNGPGALDDALRLTAAWFREHLARSMQQSGSWTGSTIDAKQGFSSRAR
jgi:putative phosphoribosyl transferase